MKAKQEQDIYPNVSSPLSILKHSDRVQEP